MTVDHTWVVSLKSGKFATTGPLPAAYNAGNRFYGRDVARTLARQLQADNYACGYFDEDWGWAVSGSIAPGLSFLIGVYLQESADSEGIALWDISVTVNAQRRFLGMPFLRVWRSAPVPETFQAYLRTVLRKIAGVS